MYISGLLLTNLQCYTHAELHFSPGINVLIGENNSGKSTLLHALLELQQPRLDAKSIRYGCPEAIIRVALENPDFDVFPLPMVEKIKDTPLERFVIQCTILAGGRAYKLDPEVVGFHQFDARYPRNFLVPYLTSRRVASLTEQITVNNVSSVSGSLEYLQPKIDNLYTSPELRPLYEDACNAVLGFLVSTYPSDDGKMAGLEIDRRKQHFISIAQMGAGVTMSLGLIVELLTAVNKVFLLEEIENDLHPRALRALARLIGESVNRGCQFIVSTHSHVVLRSLGGLPNAKVFKVVRSTEGSVVPLSNVEEVPNITTARRECLAELGYELSDYELYDGWLLLEEASAEHLIRAFVIPWYVPELAGRLRTVSAAGAGNLELSFNAFYTLFLYLHLENAYKLKAWVIADGDEAGLDAIDKLTKKFITWPDGHFRTFREHSFERYYPTKFSEEVNRVLAIQNKEQRRVEKDKLRQRVVEWLRPATDEVKAALKESAIDVIDELKSIARSLS
jgi:AAA domain, putative AbiEii toxin, Type IV TA system/AAA ATPase domain